jgi:hypothetical protein
MITPGSSGLDLLSGIEPAEPPVTLYPKDRGDDDRYGTVGRVDPAASAPDVRRPAAG